MTARTALIQALRDVFENEWGGVLSVHCAGRLGVKPLDVAERMVEPLLVQMEEVYGLTVRAEATQQAARLDVDRLARAFDAYMTGPNWKGTGSSREFAEQLAAEYVHLSEEEGPE